MVKVKPVHPTSAPTLPILSTLLDCCARDPLLGVPCLVGPTQVGKTYAVSAWAVGRGRLVTVNPQTDLPEDIAGWPVRDGQRLLFTQPSLIPPDLLTRSDWVLYVDELDKAHRDTLSALLTLLNPGERRLRATHLPAGVPIVCAMNEPEAPLPEPLLARLLFIPYPLDVEDVLTRPELGTIKRLAGEVWKMPEVSFPARPDTPGSLHRLARWTKERVFWESERLRQVVVRGLFSAKGAAIVLARLEESVPEPSVEWVKRAKPQDLAEHLIQVLTAAGIETRQEMVKAFSQRAADDPTGEVKRLEQAMLADPVILRGIGDAEWVERAQAKLAAAGR